MPYTRMKHNNKSYNLGCFKTKKEADLARNVVKKVLDKIESEKVELSEREKSVRVPPLEVLEKLINNGSFDKRIDDLSSLAFAIERRTTMVKTMRQLATSKIVLTAKEIAEISSSGVGEHI